MDNNIRDFQSFKKKKVARKHTSKTNTHTKKKSFPILTAIIAMLITIGIIYGFYHVMYSEDAATSTIPASLLYRIQGQYLNYDTAENPPVRDDVYVLYASLNDADKCLYNMFLDLVDNKDTEGYQRTVVISEQKLSEIGDEHFWNVYYAMCYDHPEHFYLLTKSSGIECFTITDDGYVAYLYNMENTNNNEDYLVSQLETAADKFLEDIDTNASDAEIELAIHDKLLETVTYDYDILDQTFDTDSNWDLGHTAYGALVADSEGRKNHAVCSGYSFAFEYLLQKVGIPCACISGSATTIPSSELDQNNHAWNAVKIDNKWYEVDITWDDSESEDGDDIYDILKNDEVKYYNLSHHYFNKTTAEMEYLPATNDTLFELDGYQPYNACYSSSHKRSNDDMDEFINSLIPLAE